MLTEKQKARLKGFRASDIYGLIELIGKDIVLRSWKMRVSKPTADETLKTLCYSEGIESGVNQLLELINKYSK